MFIPSLVLFKLYPITFALSSSYDCELLRTSFPEIKGIVIFLLTLISPKHF